MGAWSGERAESPGAGAAGRGERGVREVRARAGREEAATRRACRRERGLVGVG